MRMIKILSLAGAAGLAITLTGTTVSAHGPEHATTAPSSQTAAAQANGETVKPVFERAIPHIPGKSLIALEVTYTPGGRSPSHYHPNSAFIYAHVVAGAIRSQVGDEPAKVYQAGEGWYENPGSHHRVSENASDSEPAKLLAVFVVDPRDSLVVPEQK
ncbi:cupin domain-containing protein [Microvirga sp. HBU67558]|uniref:cupin domain-containing protein n=1 Tax=Microvirga TaxID=186650 RepID=UPI001B398CE8|nr:MULTISPECIES: cupin domain-containing protein [unclassified Microvirga]MBQ0822624.1 cupin domain-containing protein [Microvirga sp. HBU67558]